MSDKSKIIAALAISGAILVGAYVRWGSPADYNKRHKAQPASQQQSTQYHSHPVPQKNLELKASQNSSAYQTSQTPMGYTKIYRESINRDSFRRGGVYNFNSHSSTNITRSYTKVPVVPVTEKKVYIQANMPMSYEKERNYPKPYDKEQTPTLAIPPKPVPQPEPEIIPIPEPLI